MKWHSVWVVVVIVECVIIAFIGCIDLLCLLNYIQLYSWFILNNYCLTIIYFLTYFTLYWLHYIVHYVECVFTPSCFHVCTVQ